MTPAASTTLVAPFRVTWDMTARCNLHCRHCYNSSSVQAPSPEHLLRIAEELADSKIFFISLSGGEPLMEPALWDIINAFKENKKIIQLISNGTLITPSIARKIKMHGVDYVQISLDGLKETHEYQRGVPGCFEKTINAITYLREEGVSVTVNTLVTQKNKDEITDIIQLLIDLGVREYRTTRLIVMGRGEDLQPEVLTPQQTHDLITKILKLRTRYLGLMDIIPDECMCFLGEEIKQFGLEWYGCPAGRTECAVDAAGNVYPCVFLPYATFCMGNVITSSFDDIWCSEKFEAFRQIERSCDCPITDFCKGGCIAAAYARYGDIYRKDPYCWRDEE